MSDLRERGLRPPLLGITGGNPALVSAFEQVFSESRRQRGAVHVARNVIAKEASSRSAPAASPRRTATGARGRSTACSRT